MPRTPEVERLDFVVGQMLALAAVVKALIKSHPNAAKLAEEMEGATQIQLAKLENERRASDKMIKGFQSARRKLLGEKSTRRESR